MIQHQKKKIWDAKYCEFILVNTDEDGNDVFLTAEEADKANMIINESELSGAEMNK